jgi:signal transduction histidine kinase
LDFFNCVGTDSHAACGFAMASKKRVIIEDVTQSPIFLNTPALDVQLEAGVRAVVSTPFFTRSGEFLGVISTHYRTARQPAEFDLRLLDLLVRQAADFVERTQNEQKLEDYSKNLEKLVEERTKQLKDSERLATIGATAGMVGHDIRNPLQAITGDVYLAKTELASIPESEEKKSALESLQEIEKNTDYINKIVQDLQDFARPLKPNIEEVDLKIIIEDLLKKNGLPENVKVSVKVESDARKIVADSTFVNRVMYNLVNNAVQAMPKGGKLTIHSYKEANDILITVKDTGVGIPEAVKGKLFTPMFTTKAKGQGFGLPVIKRMTEALGGTVTFESQEGKGTTFIIRLHKELKGK